jgi:hypothetical protein
VEEGPAVSGKALEDEPFPAEEPRAEPLLEGDPEGDPLRGANERVLLRDQLASDLREVTGMIFPG